MLRDEVVYEPPLGILGRWLGGGLLEAKLTRLFDYRHEATRRIVEAGDFCGHDRPPVAGDAGAEPAKQADRQRDSSGSHER